MAPRLPLPSLAVVAPDTDMGKTTLCAMLLHAAFRHEDCAAFAYWKPVQSGAPDSERVEGLCAGLAIRQHPPVRSFALPAAPTEAARVAGAAPVTIQELLDAAPDLASEGPWLVETLGGPLSPLADDVSQIDWLVALGLPVLLVTKNRVGAISGTLCAEECLRARGLEVRAIVLLGEHVPGNAASITAASGVRSFELEFPESEDRHGYARRSADLVPLLTHLAVPRGAGEEDSKLRALDAARLWHPYSPLVGETARPICVRAQGEWLELDTGERLVDAISSWWTSIHGHAHPRLRSALARAARSHDQVIFAGLAHEPGVRLAEELLEFLPDSFERVFYSDNGSTAVEVALKIVHGAWRRRGAVGDAERRLFLCLEHAYHGDTFGTMAIGRDPAFFGELEPLLFDVVQIPLELDSLEEALAQHGTELAGLVVEPLIQAAGGMRMHGPAVLEQFCLRARAAGLPVIFDEVMTGFGRTGTMFAFEQLPGFVPDVLCLAKGLSGGVLPLAATLVNEEWTEPWCSADRARMLFHGHSYTANPLACATGRESLALFREGEPLAGARRIAERWKELCATEWPARVREVRSRGTVIAFDLAPRGEDEARGGGYLSPRRERVIELGRAEGVFLRPLGDVVYAMPPLSTGDAALDRIEAALRRIAGEA